MISQTKVIVRYAETDKMGIVHHSVYPIWYEAARTEAIKKMYTDFEPKICYKAKALNFKNPQFVYEAISNFVPVNEELK